MSNRRESSLDNLLSEVHELRERMEDLFPPYISSLRRLSQVPMEFDRRSWASCIDSLILKVKGDYEKYQVARNKVDLVSKFMTAAADIALIAARKEPVPFPTAPEISISISPEGKIEPVVDDGTAPPVGVILLTFEEFQEVALKLRQMVMEGAVVPKGEDEIPRLIYTLASG